MMSNNVPLDRFSISPNTHDQIPLSHVLVHMVVKNSKRLDILEHFYSCCMWSGVAQLVEH